MHYLPGRTFLPGDDKIFGVADSMSEIRRVAGNTAALSLSKVIRLSISLALSVILVRYLGPEHLGNWAAARSLCALAAVLISLGMSNIAIRECAPRLNDTRRYLETLLSLRLIFSLIAAGGVLILVKFFGYRAEIAHLVFIALGFYIFNALGEAFVVPFRCWEKMGYEAVINIFKDLLLMLLVFLAVYLRWGVLRIAYLYLGANLFYLFFSWLVVRTEFFRPRLSLDLSLARHLLIAGFPVGIAIFFNSYHDISRIIIQKVLGSSAAGYYSAAVLPFIALESTVVISLMGALFPLIARLHVSDQNRLLTIYQRVSKYLYLISLGGAVFCLLLSDELVALFFGAAYIDSAGVLKMLTPAIVLMFQNYLLYNAMVASRREKLFALIIGGSALLNALGVFLLSKSLGIEGGALALGSANLFSLVFFSLILRRKYGRIPLTRVRFRPLASAVVAGALIWWEKSLNFPLGVMIISGIVAYGLLIFSFGVFTPEDRTLFKSVFPGLPSAQKNQEQNFK